MFLDMGILKEYRPSAPLLFSIEGSLFSLIWGLLVIKCRLLVFLNICSDYPDWSTQRWRSFVRFKSSEPSLCCSWVLFLLTTQPRWRPVFLCDHHFALSSLTMTEQSVGRCCETLYTSFTVGQNFHLGLASIFAFCLIQPVLLQVKSDGFPTLALSPHFFKKIIVKTQSKI